MSTKYIASNWRLLNKAGVDSYKSDNYGLSFSGTSEYINCGGQSLFNGLTAFSVSCWIKRNGAQQAYASILTYQTSTSQYLKLFFSATGSSDKIEMQVRPGSTNPVKVISSAGSIPDGEWVHIAVVGDANNLSNLNLYINGVLDNDVTSGNITTLAQSSDIYIGTDAGAITSREFEGEISELSIFDYSLSSTQISTLYGSSSLGAGNPMALKPQPVAFYNLADNSSGNPLTQPNEAVEDASVFDFTPPDHINLGNPEELQITGAITLSLWFNSTTATGGFITKSLNGGYFGNNAQKVFELGLLSNTLYWIISDGTSSDTLSHSFSSYLDGDWHHLMVTWDGTTNAASMKLFVDGSEIDDNQATISAIQNVANDVVISSKGAAYDYNGKISNVAIWNSDQSLEISNIYNSGVPATSYTNTPTAWYKLDQSANWEADSSGAWQIPDAVSAYPQSFDFVPNDKIDATISALNNATALTFSGWVKKTSGNVIGFESFASGTDRAILYWWSDNNVYWSVRNGSSSSAASSALTIYDWNHIAGTFDGATNTIKLYINGSLVDTETGQPSSTSANLASNFHIGLSNGSTYNTGQISNVQIFNSVLPATGSNSIETLYNNGSPLTTAIASDNLKLWAKLDNTATFSTNWSIPDASGNGNTGTSSGMTEQNLVNNNVSALNGESNGMTSANLVLSDLTRAVPYDSYSFDFDGSLDKITIPSTLSSLGISTEFTVSVWFNSTNLGLYDTIINAPTTATAWSSGFGLQIVNSKLRFWVNEWSTANYFTESSTLSANTWYHAVGTFSSTNGIRLYFEGELVDTATNNVLDGLTNTMTIGASITSYYFDGKLSNISIYDKALTSTEVQKLYSNGVPQDLANFTPAPVAWYPLGSNSFWNGSQWTVRDMIGSNDGTGQNIGIDGLVGDAPRSEADGTGTNMDIPTNLEGTTKWSSNNSYSINMSSTARVQDTP